MLHPDNFVSTVYEYNLSLKTSKMRKSFKGGRALFTQAPLL